MDGFKDKKQKQVERKNEVNYDRKTRQLIAYFLGIATAILLILLILLIYTSVDYIYENIRVVVVVIIVFSLFLLLALLLINRYKEKLFETFFGLGETDLKEIDIKIYETVDNISKNKIGEASTTGIYLGKKFFAWYSWKMYRQYVVQIVQVIFVILGGVIGSYLLFIQNEKIENQNTLIIDQNKNIEKQNAKIEKQVYLEEASRRNNLVLLMDNILSKVNLEITDSEKKLSQPLISRIQALAQGFQPYYFLKDSTNLIEEKYSPERGQFLLALANSGIDSVTMDKIYKKAPFSRAYLKGANLSSLNLQRVNLKNANLQEANLTKANLKRANLEDANLKGADLRFANLNRAKLKDADLRGVDLKYADLQEAYLKNVDLQGVNLLFANFQNAEFENVNLNGAHLFGDWFEKLEEWEVKGYKEIKEKYKLLKSAISIDGKQIYVLYLKENIE